MRLVRCTVPLERSDLVVHALQTLGLCHSVTRSNGECASVITAYVATHASGQVLHALDLVGCGSAYGRIALQPVELLKPLPRVLAASADSVRRAHWRDHTTQQPTAEQRSKEANAKARLAIEEIYQDVHIGTTVSFDFVAFTAIASAIAGLGLITNNTVMIVASMLVSPLMGPILAFTFGTVVADSSMFYHGLYMELIGTLISFVVGLLTGGVGAAWADQLGWPTNEMSSRGQWSSLLIGLVFAVPSGAGVALSVTSGGGNSLVGVAIAASLLPPVVNTGVCLAFAAVVAVWPAHFHAAHFHSRRFLNIGGLSLALFAINVSAIFAVSVALFRFKGIRPIRRQLLNWEEIPAIELMEDFGESEVAEASDCAPEEQQHEEQPAAIDAAAEDTAGVAASSSTSSVSAPRLVDGEKSRGKARWGQLREAIQEAVETLESQGVEVKDNLFQPMKAKYLQKKPGAGGCVVA